MRMDELLDFVLIQWAGFFIQSFPVAILAFVAIEDENIRYSRGKCLLMVTVFLVAASAGLAAVTLAAPVTLRMVCSNLYAGAVIAVMLLYFLWIIKKRTMAVFLVYMLVLHYAAVIYTVSAQVTFGTTFKSRGANFPYDGKTLLIYVILYLLTGVFVYPFFRHIVRDSIAVMEKKEMKKACLYVLATLLLYILAVPFILFYAKKRLVPLICLALTDALVYLIFFNEIYLMRRQMKLQNTMEIWQLQYETITADIENARRLHHDTRQHFRVITMLNRQGNQEALDEYLSSYENLYLKDERSRYCEDAVIDGLLSFYAENAAMNHVEFQAYVTLGPLKGEDQVNLTVLLGNCLENALKSCRQIAEEKGTYIYLDMGIKDRKCLIQIRNSVSAERSGGTQGKRKGFGLRSVQEIAARYQGTAEFIQNEREYVTRIILEIPE